MRKIIKYIIACLLCLFITNNIYSQKHTKKIVYNFGDSVNYYVKEYLKSENVREYYCHYREVNPDVIRIYISKYTSNDLYKALIKLNNRYLMVDDDYIPIVFETDDDFAEILNRKVQPSYGPELILKQTKSGGGYYIELRRKKNSDLEIIERGFDQ
jgi:hypothetical protein